MCPEPGGNDTLGYGKKYLEREIARHADQTRYGQRQDEPAGA